NSPAVDKLIQMNKKALDEYGAQDWEAAKRTLLQALVFAKKSGLDTHPMMARTYVHLGAVYVVGFKDRAKGAQSFGRAVEIDPGIRISKAMSTPELEGVFDEAKGGAGGGGKASSRGPGGAEPSVSTAPPPSGKRRKTPIMESDTGADAPPADEAAAPKARKRPVPPEDDESIDPDLPSRVAALDCPVKDEAEIDKPVLVRCAVAKNLSKVVEVVLFYLEPGKTDFTDVPLERSPKGWYVGKIPKKAVTGTSLRYYIEGRNVDGKPLVANGSKDSPNLMLIRDAEAAATEKEIGGKRHEENPLDEPNPNRPHRLLGHIDRSKIGVDTRYGNRSFWVGLGIGSGYGFGLASNLEVRKELASTYGSGIAWAGLGQVAPEIGFQINPDVAI